MKANHLEMRAQMQTSKFRKEIIFLNVLLTMAVINFWHTGSNFQEIMRIRCVPAQLLCTEAVKIHSCQDSHSKKEWQEGYLAESFSNFQDKLCVSFQFSLLINTDKITWQLCRAPLHMWREHTWFLNFLSEKMYNIWSPCSC